MKAKQLEAILGRERTIGEGEMVQRFQKLRDMRLLPTSRGRNAEDITLDAVVSGVLSVVAERPAFAGMTARVLSELRPVGGEANAFAGAATFAQALLAALRDPALLDSVAEIRMTDGEVYTNAHGRAAIIFRDRGERATYYVPGTAVLLLQPGSNEYSDLRELSSSIIRETIVFPRLLKTIVRQIREDEPPSRLISQPVGQHVVG